MTMPAQTKTEIYAEEFRFFSSLIGPQAALYRLADAYGVKVESMRTELRDAGIHILIDAREVPA